MSAQLAILGGGCFWCVEAVMKHLKGVEQVVSGYAGGHTPAPSYREVCSGRTGHAEVVQVTFDPDQLSYKDLVEVFMTTHDPTTLNRQGGDVGAQYRSTIMYRDDKQREIAEQVLKELKSVFPDPIVTEVTPLKKFYPAEDHHQNYYAQNSGQPYCNAVITPKLAKLRAKHAAKLKPSPV